MVCNSSKSGLNSVSRLFIAVTYFVIPALSVVKSLRVDQADFLPVVGCVWAKAETAKSAAKTNSWRQ